MGARTVAVLMHHTAHKRALKRAIAAGGTAFLGLRAIGHAASHICASMQHHTGSAQDGPTSAAMTALQAAREANERAATVCDLEPVVTLTQALS